MPYVLRALPRWVSTAHAHRVGGTWQFQVGCSSATIAIANDSHSELRHAPLQFLLCDIPAFSTGGFFYCIEQLLTCSCGLLCHFSIEIADKLIYQVCTNFMTRFEFVGRELANVLPVHKSHGYLRVHASDGCGVRVSGEVVGDRHDARMRRVGCLFLHRPTHLINVAPP